MSLYRSAQGVGKTGCYQVTITSSCLKLLASLESAALRSTTLRDKFGPNQGQTLMCESYNIIIFLEGAIRLTTATSGTGNNLKEYTDQYMRVIWNNQRDQTSI